MNEVDVDQNVATFEPPLLQDLTEELIDFWQEVFDTSYESFRDMLAGGETGQNHDIIYLIRKGTKLAGTCHLTICQSVPELGGLGEAGTASDFRRMGVASTLCAHARDDFCKGGGQALFLGTGNPAAARVYSRLGWRKLVGTNVMASIAGGHPPETFLVDCFRNDGGPVTVTAGSPTDRIPMIPLLISPHDWQIMDANVGMHSTRYVVQTSCMGLYPRYERFASCDQGAWFVVRTSQGRTVGISTSRLDGSGECQVDGFTHHNYRTAFGSLLDATISWAATHGASLYWSRVSIEDEDKISRFEGLGFRRVRVDEPFDLGGRQVMSLRLEKNT